MKSTNIAGINLLRIKNSKINELWIAPLEMTATGKTKPLGISVVCVLSTDIIFF